MQHPRVIIIPGDDFSRVVAELKTAKVSYILEESCIPHIKTKLQVEEYCWPVKSNDGVSIAKLRPGLKLPFFNPEPVKLTWDVAACIPKDKILPWIINVDNDVKLWNSDVDNDVKLWNSNVTLTNKEKLSIIRIVNHRIRVESETLRIYTEALMSTFLHPSIQDLLHYCICNKNEHITMWCQIKKQFDFPDYTGPIHKTSRIPAIILEKTVEDLTEVIAIEALDRPSATVYISQLTNKGQLGQLLKLVQRRDKESKQNAEMLKTLLTQVRYMYCFLGKSIKEATKNAKYIANFNNKRISQLKY